MYFGGDITMVNILILEDEKIQRKNLAKMLEELGANYKVFEAESTPQALNIAQMNDINLFYIDINLGNSSGLDFALEIRKREKYKFTWMVFITTDINYMIRAFKETHCYDYLLKPYSKNKVHEITHSLTESLQTKNNVFKEEREFIVVDMKGISIKIFVDEIIFVAVYLRTSCIYTKKKVYEINNLPLKKVIDMVKNKSFMQSHRSFFINLTYVQEIDKTQDTWTIHFNNTEETAFVGEKFKKDIQTAFKSLDL
jgi:Response regulator of the LytR/AlgR family